MRRLASYAQSYAQAYCARVGEIDLDIGYVCLCKIDLKIGNVRLTFSKINLNTDNVCLYVLM